METGKAIPSPEAGIAPEMAACREVMFLLCSHRQPRESSGFLRPICTGTRGRHRPLLRELSGAPLHTRALTKGMMCLSNPQNPSYVGENVSEFLHPMSNALHPDLMSAAERLDEIAEILAAGLMRLRARQSTPLFPDGGDSSLDCSAHQSGHADILTDGGLE